MSWLVHKLFLASGGLVWVQQHAFLANPDEEGYVALIDRVRNLYFVSPFCRRQVQLGNNVLLSMGNLLVVSVGAHASCAWFVLIRGDSRQKIVIEVDAPIRVAVDAFRPT